MGLRDSQHIARIMVHPTNPDIVYVAAMGHLFSTNAERGVFKTTDGGKTWKKVLYVNDKVGAVDLMLVRSAPDTLYAAMYDKVRLPWNYEMGGPESGDLQDDRRRQDLVSPRRRTARPGRIGRIGLDVFQKNPDILYAIVENGNPRPADRPGGRAGQAPRRRPASADGRATRSTGADDGGKILAQGRTRATKRPSTKRPIRSTCSGWTSRTPDTVYVTGQSLASTNDGGRTWKGLSWPSNGVFERGFGDWRTLWVDPADSNRLIFGSDGGVYISYDRGRTCRHFDNVPGGEFYAIGVDMEDPYNIYGGLQDHDSWKGPSNGWAGEVALSDWVTVGDGDGSTICVDPTDSRWVYNNREFGAMWRLDQKTGVQTDIPPQRAAGAEAACASTGRRRSPCRRTTRPSSTPGAQVLFRSLDRGDHWQEISPDLTTDDDVEGARRGQHHLLHADDDRRVAGQAGRHLDRGRRRQGPGDERRRRDLARPDGEARGRRGARRTSGSAASSPRRTRPGRASSPRRACVSTIFQPVLYKTTDYGETWTSIAGDLPAGKPINVVIQDRKNAGPALRRDRTGRLRRRSTAARPGAPFKANMPWLKVTDLLIHPRENDLVVATFGRSLWITDISPLQETERGDARPRTSISSTSSRGRRGFTAPSSGITSSSATATSRRRTSPTRSTIRYYLKAKAAGPVKVTVADPYGKSWPSSTGKGEAGLNTVAWSMRARGRARADAGIRGLFRRRRAWSIPGEYVVTLEAGGRKLVKKVDHPRPPGLDRRPCPGRDQVEGAEDICGILMDPARTP